MAEDHIDSDAFAAATQELQNLAGLMKTLNDDVLQFRAAKDSAARRALVRAVFAYIEGSSFGFRSAALSLACIRNVSLTVAESLICREVTYALNEKGQVEERQILSPSLANLRFALAIFSKVAGAPYDFPAGDSQFESLQVAQRIRNRLMHPRRIQELEVSPEEQAIVTGALDWIREQQTKIVAAFAFRLYSGLQAFYVGLDTLPKTLSGGYATSDVTRIFFTELTNSKPISLEEATEWCSAFLKAQGSNVGADQL